MSWTRAAFGELPWVQGGHPLEQKKVVPPGMTLLCFQPGFEDPNWCPRSHVLFVVSGTLRVQFESESVVVPQGEAIQIAAGTLHKVAVEGDRATTLFVVSELEQFAAK